MRHAFGRARAGQSLPVRKRRGTAVGRRNDENSFETLLRKWRQTTRSAASALSTTDGRWALVSTSVTALVAGSVAWLAAGIVPPANARTSDGQPSMLPYQLFLRLASRDDAARANYAAFGPTGPIVDRATHRDGDGFTLDSALQAQQLDDDAEPGTDTHTVTMDSGDTLVGALTDAGVTGDDANAAVVALAKIYNLRTLRAGQSFEISVKQVDTPSVQITYTPANAAQDNQDDDGNNAAPALGQLLSMKFSPTVDHEITLTRNPDGGFVADDVQKELTERHHHAGAKIDSSLYLAAMQAGIPADVVVEMIHMFSYEVDFQRDIHPGDSFEVLYNYYYTPEGLAAKEGEIAYAAMTLHGQKIALYRFQPNDSEPADYFNAKGQSAKSMLMKTPVDGARISSGFGMRFHPVLGYSRMHKGIDFAVPIGTPVMAAGSGTIAFAGRKSGYGNYVKVQMPNGYATAYGHLSRFAAGIRQGTHVRQGQIIAYSGNTGMSTGPHLHYEIVINGNQVNPLKVKVATGRKLNGKDLKTFMATRAGIDGKLASMPLETKLADNTADLRAAKD
ncbi:MAG: peptidoglycan DD-metalloendopeptidase family protein [Alphaproteobacteria bacterium]|nr:peptidoglycan DD-metalloendopeptidase family protein [Alphaproteobacteria bacterium]